MSIPTISGGIFDFILGGYTPPTWSGSIYSFTGGFSDLGATVSGINVVGTKDLGSYIKSTIQAYKDLGAYIKPSTQSYTDLVAAIRRLDQDDEDLGGQISGWDTKDLGSFIGAHPPADLQALLNVIEIIDLPATIVGEFLHGESDLGAEFFRIWDRKYLDLIGLLQGYDYVDLDGYINPVYKSDLQAVIQSTTTFNLGGSLFPIDPANLNGLIHGWDTLDLAASLIGGYGPYDIQAYLNAVPSVNLGSYIAGFKGIQIPFNLQAILSGWQSLDLSAVISAISAVNLGANINAIGKILDLGATIVPKTILMKRALQISLLEHKDLKALINFQCFGSDSVNLPASVYAISKLDLKAYIIGWYGGAADNIKELGAYINAADYVSQDAINLSFIPEISKYTQLNVRFGVVDIYTTFDTIDVLYGSFYSSNLTATINGVLTNYDLGASVTPIIQSNYTGLPDNVYPRTHETVFDLTDKGRENWRRFVELMFRRDGADPYHYFYVSGSGGVYKLDRGRHWSILAGSYLKDDEDIVERKSVRRKFIFNLSKYTTIDEAIRDLIDRVSEYRRVNLGASITAIEPNYSNLTASISIKYKRTWVKHLKASITGI